MEEFVRLNDEEQMQSLKYVAAWKKNFSKSVAFNLCFEIDRWELLYIS